MIQPTFTDGRTDDKGKKRETTYTAIIPELLLISGFSDIHSKPVEDVQPWKHDRHLKKILGR